MKKKQFIQLRGRTEVDLKKELATREASMEKLMEDLASGKVKNVRAIHVVKKEIAQISTLLNEKARAREALLKEKKSV